MTTKTKKPKRTATQRRALAKGRKSREEMVGNAFGLAAVKSPLVIKRLMAIAQAPQVSQQARDHLIDGIDALIELANDVVAEDADPVEPGLREGEAAPRPSAAGGKAKRKSRAP
jgi:hypothetical protein